MKLTSLLFVSLFVFAQASQAKTLAWNEIESEQSYKLNELVAFPGVLDLHVGDSIIVDDVVTGDFPFVYIQTHLTECHNPELKSEMVLANPSPEDTSRDRSVGLQLYQHCELDIYIEPSDIMSKSLFTE